MQEEKTKIVIIGGGLSGLTAAEKLLSQKQANIDVVVLEAMDRVGGRTQTVEIEGVKFDLGGQWVGKTQKHVRKLAERCENELIPQWHTGSKILHLGKHVSTYKTNIPLDVGIIALIHMQMNIWKLDKMANKLNTENPRQNCVMAMLWDSMTVKTWIQQNIYFEKVKLLFECAIRAVLGVETDEVSFLFFLWYIRQNGGVENLINIENGLQQKKMKHGSQFLSQFLKKKIEEMGGKVLLNSTVDKVVQRQDEKNPKVQIFFGEKQKIQCDYLVIAMPPARVRKIKFQPQLSRERRMICDRNIMGSISKVHLLYNQTYWRDKGFSGQTLSNCFETAVFNAYDDTKIKQNGEIQPAILVFINAQIDREWSKKQNREFAEQNILQTLCKYFKDEKMLTPTSIHWKSWNDEPSLNGGPVAVFPPGVLTKISDIRKPQKRIHWAGTEMARESQGFMDGAIQSGERVADEILQKLKKSGSKPQQKTQETHRPTSSWYSKIITSKSRWFEWL